MAFRVIIESEEQLLDGLMKLNKINALGEKITIGTYIPDAEITADILNKKVKLFNSLDDEDDDVVVVGISVCIENDDTIKEYPEIIGKNGVSVGLYTIEDVNEGDVFSRIVSFDDMIEETIKLINR